MNSLRTFLTLGLALVATWAVATPPAPRPPGAVVALGGALKVDNTAVWSRLVQEAGGRGATFAVFATAAENPERSGERIAQALNAAGAKAEVIPVAPRLPTTEWKALRDDAALAQRVSRMQGVFFSGGAQELITSTLRPDGRSTAVLQAVRQVLERGGVVAGTSAGAAIMSEWMFRDAQDTLAVLKGRMREGQEIDRGLGFAGPDIFVDQHFLKRGRIGRILPVMQAKGYRWGLGVEENSGAIIRGHQVEVIGARGVLVVDLSAAQRRTDLSAFNVQGALLSYLERGDRHDFATGVTTPAPEKLAGTINPRSPDFKPFFKRAPFHPDMLGDSTIANAMAQLVDSPDEELLGLAFNGRALAQGSKAAADDLDPTLGFEFRLSKAADSRGYFTGAWGGEDYTVTRIRLDVTPVRLNTPLYQALTPNRAADAR
ncbi:MAG: cyanophycinase [Inhella sp.]|jgi:cyanophycinase|uniref:cyanophycinase n=1 Tax=Inhella sp. TaxID=1921806 RepID=UPI0022BB9D3B|nr:cyanophycinase [Inhella sp.]MCZ8233544.1 cyanophycinase [Inhella sp.]